MRGVGWGVWGHSEKGTPGKRVQQKGVDNIKALVFTQ